MTGPYPIDADGLRARTRALLDAHPPATTDRTDFLRARFDAGLAWVHYPVGLGGLDAPRALQTVVDAELAAAGAPTTTRAGSASASAWPPPPSSRTAPTRSSAAS